MKTHKFDIKAKQKKIIWLSILAIILLGIAITLTKSFGITRGYITADGLRLRKAPVDGEIITHLYTGNEVEILSEQKVGNTTWYQVQVNGNSGYVSGDYVGNITEEPAYVNDSDFEKQLTKEGFPESYKPALRRLHTKHPNWRFKAQLTNLDWNQVIEKESVPGYNLVPYTMPAECKSTHKDAYDPVTGKYKFFDDGGWVAASPQMVRYYMDPRNFLNEGSIFQFVSHQFDAETQTKTNLESVLSGTFMEASKGFPESGYKTYGDVLYKAGSDNSVNPMTLASMIIQEQGISGQGASIQGNNSTFPGYYNYFNIGAFPADGYGAVEHGLLTAKKYGWNTRVKSILGGSKWYADNYVSGNQYTFYLKKFNVMNGYSSVATSQYMTNVMGAYSEGVYFAKGFPSGKSSVVTFAIPVFNNMPETPSSYPGNSSNINYLASLSVGGYSLNPVFNPNETEYELSVPYSTNSVKISASAVDKGAKITGTGSVTLKQGKNKVTVICTSPSGVPKTYTINITRKSSDDSSTGSNTGGNTGGNAGGNADNDNNGDGDDSEDVIIDANIESPSISDSQPSREYITKCTKFDLPDNIGSSAGSSINKPVGVLVKVYDKNFVIVDEYRIILPADINGDGKVNSADAVVFQKLFSGSMKLEDVITTSANPNYLDRLEEMNLQENETNLGGDNVAEDVDNANGNDNVAEHAENASGNNVADGIETGKIDDSKETKDILPEENPSN